jgi:RimJ/RimL family protein N-acetyltransferase
MCSISITPRQATTRLSLRPLSPRDAGRIAQLANDFDVTKMTSRMPYPYSLADAEAFLALDPDPACEVTFAIDHPQAGLIGVMGFHGSDPVQPELGYWIGRDYWGQGYATEAAEAALIWASRDWGKRSVKAGHFADNAASGWVLTKAGFLYTGVVEMTPSLARGAPAPSRKMVWLP